jgi:uncharacterized membrane protein YdbT with pleckstrin-like domain
MGYIEKKRILLFGLPWTFTKYTIEEDIINIKEGLLKTIENDCYMYKVQDVQLETTLSERVFGLGTVVCYTGDTTHQKLILSHIRHAREIKNYILEASENARMKRRTLNTLDIGSGAIDDLDADDCHHS